MGQGGAKAPWSLCTPTALRRIGLYLCYASLLFYQASRLARLSPPDAAGVSQSHPDILSATCPLAPGALGCPACCRRLLACRWRRRLWWHVRVLSVLRGECAGRAEDQLRLANSDHHVAGRH